ncbi:MAG: DUF58 domain-containing protein [Planctomycetia bacterium]
MAASPPAGPQPVAARAALATAGPVHLQLTLAGRVLLSACSAVGLVAWSQGAEGTALLACLCLALLVLAVRLARRNLAGVSVAQALEPRARAGVPCVATLQVTAGSGRAREDLQLEQARPRGALPAAGRACLARLEAGATAQASLPLSLRTRGDAQLSRVRVHSAFPWGLVHAEVVAEAPARVLAWPREGRPTPALRARLRAGRAAGARMALASTAPDDLHGVRAWREGDDPRRLHAASSLRRGEPAVADWRERQAEQVELVLGAHPGAAEAACFERAVSVAASLWSLCQREGLPCTLHAGARRASLPSGYAAGLDLLARVRVRETAALPAVLERSAARRAGAGLVVVVGGAAAGAQLAAARGAGARGLPAWWLDVRGPGLARWVEGL